MRGGGERRGERGVREGVREGVSTYLIYRKQESHGFPLSFTRMHWNNLLRYVVG